MRVFVYEYLSAGGMAGEPGAESLAREGAAMLRAVAADLAACGVEVATMPWGDDEAEFRRLVRECRQALVIAPEFDDLLARRAGWVLEEGGELLGPSPEAIRLTGDKLALAKNLSREGVPTPATVPYPGRVTFPAVVKPRFGAGAQDTFRVRDEAEYGAAGRVGEMIAQPECPGVAASVALLVGPNGAIPLLPGVQRIQVEGGRYGYAGGRFPLEERLRPTAVDLATRAAGGVPGLRGYVGVDLVLGETNVVIEINPRLTTSYVGLRRLAAFNIMQAMLDVLAGRRPGPLEYSPGEVSFLPDGTILDGA